MKRKKKIFEAIMAIGMAIYMVMLFMMLFIDFTILELMIPLTVGFIGYFGSNYYTKQMKKRRQMGYR